MVDSYFQVSLAVMDFMSPRSTPGLADSVSIDTWPLGIPSAPTINPTPIHTLVFISCLDPKRLAPFQCLSSLVSLSLEHCSSAPGEFRLSLSVFSSCGQLWLPHIHPANSPFSCLSCVLAKEVHLVHAKQVFCPLTPCHFCFQGRLLLDLSPPHCPHVFLTFWLTGMNVIDWGHSRR